MQNRSGQRLDRNQMPRWGDADARNWLDPDRKSVGPVIAWLSVLRSLSALDMKNGTLAVGSGVLGVALDAVQDKGGLLRLPGKKPAQAVEPTRAGCDQAGIA